MGSNPGFRIEDLFPKKVVPGEEPAVEDVSMDEPRATRSIYPCERFDLKCGDCGSEMRIRTSKRFSKPFYGCVAYPTCKGTHGAHRDGRPLGTPADSATKMARMNAHRLFDLIWQGKHMSRGHAYAWMRRKMNLGDDDAHIGNFDIAMCNALMDHVRTAFPFVRNAWDRVLEDPFAEDEALLGDDDIPF
jgi:hypothetical protein